MLSIKSTKLFEKDLKRIEKRHLDLKKLNEVVELLVKKKPIPEKYRNHKLRGNFGSLWECHITPDWLLVYQKSLDSILLVRTGSHSDIFK